MLHHITLHHIRVWLCLCASEVTMGQDMAFLWNTGLVWPPKPAWWDFPACAVFQMAQGNPLQCSPASCRIVFCPVHSKKLCQSCTETPGWNKQLEDAWLKMKHHCHCVLRDVPCGECASCTCGNRCCGSSGCWPWSWAAINVLCQFVSLMSVCCWCFDMSFLVDMSL